MGGKEGELEGRWGGNEGVKEDGRERYIYREGEKERGPRGGREGERGGGGERRGEMGK